MVSMKEEPAFQHDGQIVMLHHCETRWWFTQESVNRKSHILEQAYCRSHRPSVKS